MKKLQIAFLLLITILLFYPMSGFSDIVLVVNKEVEENTLSKEEIKQIFLRNKTRWKNEGLIEFVIQDEGTTHKEFLKTYVGRSSKQYIMTMRQLVFLGKGDFPKKFQTDRELIEYIAANKNTIGYVENDNVNDTVKKILVK